MKRLRYTAEQDSDMPPKYIR